MLNWYKKNRLQVAEVLFFTSIFGAALNAAEAFIQFNWTSVAMALGAYALSLYWLSVVVEES